MSEKSNPKQTCPVCKSENTALQVTCGACGAFIRERVPSLHLFETVWSLFESPYEGLQRILLSEQKNYVYLLQILFGIACVSFFFRFVNIGLIIPDLQTILLLSLLAGPVAGILLVTMITAIVYLIARRTIAAISLRDIRAVISYATVPVIISVLVIYPVETGIFGLHLFSDDPPARELQPVLYGLLITLDGLLILWSVILLYLGFKVATGKTSYAAVITGLVVIGVLTPIVISVLVIKRIY